MSMSIYATAMRNREQVGQQVVMLSKKDISAELKRLQTTTGATHSGVQNIQESIDALTVANDQKWQTLEQYNLHVQKYVEDRLQQTASTLFLTSKEGPVYELLTTLENGQKSLKDDNEDLAKYLKTVEDEVKAAKDNNVDLAKHLKTVEDEAKAAKEQGKQLKVWVMSNWTTERELRNIKEASKDNRHYEDLPRGDEERDGAQGKLGGRTGVGGNQGAGHGSGQRDEGQS